jgi:uncharacterized protein (DUF1684 family)
VSIVAAILGGCGGDAAPVLDEEPKHVGSDYAAEVDAWHAERVRRLEADDGWLTLVGLRWLAPGENRVGQAASCAVAYEGFPVEDVGTITRVDGALRFEMAPGAAVEGVPADGVLRSDADGAPTVLTLGTCRFHVIRRGERYGVRVKDANAPTRRQFAGIERYPVDRAWRYEARFVPADAGATTPVDLVIGTTLDQEIAGRAELVMAGHAISMVLMPGSEPDRYFVVFGDGTNGSQTYGGGRFLEATRDGDAVILDFNRAYNPPCSFTPYATCPLPVDDNRLPVPVTAGEKHP